MRSVTVVGAGQAGLPLAVGLLKAGYDVRVVAERTAAEIELGPVLSSQGMQSAGVAAERGLGVDLWAGHAPVWEGLGVTIRTPERGVETRWRAERKDYGESIDLRRKLSGLLRLVAYLGGEVLVNRASISDLEEYARTSDLVVIGVGRGELAELFGRDLGKSPFHAPQRVLALTYLDGVVPREDFTGPVVTVVPGVGEIVVFPGLSLNGPCEILTFEGVPGGPLDCWDDVDSASEHLGRTREVLVAFAPDEAARCADAVLTDERAFARGSVVPIVRRPVAVLPSGAPVLGIGDAVVLNDPVTGQGANNAAKAALTYRDAIVRHGERPFDAAWMHSTFAEHWSTAQHSTRFTNLMLSPPEHVVSALLAAECHPELADRIAAGFDRPETLDPWFFEPERTAEYLRALEG